MRSKHVKFLMLLLLLFSFTIVTSNAQVIKCRAYGISMRAKNIYSGQWSEWTDFSEVDILITIDTDNERVKIFSPKTQVFDIIKSFEKYTDNDGDETLKFQCVNEDGLTCFVRLVRLNSQERHQLYVDYSNSSLAYNIRVLDN